MKIRPNDTIAAIATPIGEGAIAVVRVSGSESLGIVDKVFRGKTALRDASGYTVHLGEVWDQENKKVDQVLATVFREPHSYTGENSVELSCHGGILISNLVLGAILAAGARPADPGEFTKRAFLNGKLDLSQAEAVADIIAARSQKACEVSMSQLNGKLSERIGSLKKDLLEAASLLELELDFSTENVPIVERHQVQSVLSRARNSVDALLSTYELGKAYRDGVSVIIVGKPNAGKSSLFNRILMDERAIVAPIPGTTRDYIEESIVINGILFKLFDTAGLREPSGSIEAIGISKTRSLSRTADIILEVIDAAEPDGGSDLEARSAKSIKVFNKVDLVNDKRIGEIAVNLALQSQECVFVSALTGYGVDDLRETLAATVSDSQVRTQEDIRITNSRHKDALVRCMDGIDRAADLNDVRISNELVSFEIRQSVDALSEIVGEISTDDILNAVFGRFCIGK